MSLVAADWEEAATSILQEGEDGAVSPWTPERLEVALEPFLAEYERVVFDHQARLSHNTRIEQTAPRLWEVSRVLVDPEGDNTWALEGVVDLRQETDSTPCRCVRSGSRLDVVARRFEGVDAIDLDDTLVDIRPFCRYHREEE